VRAPELLQLHSSSSCLAEQGTAPSHLCCQGASVALLLNKSMSAQVLLLLNKSM
jgi:hypothetical protein